MSEPNHNDIDYVHPSDRAKTDGLTMRCPNWLDGRVQCVNDAGHELGLHQYDPDEIRRAFPKWTNEQVVAVSFVPLPLDEEMTEAEKIEFTEAINAAIPDPKPKTGYCWKCAEEFPMSELIEDDDPYIKDEDDPNDKNYQCKPCMEADEQ